MDCGAKVIRTSITAFALTIPTLLAAQIATHKVGESYELRRTYRTKDVSTASSGSSSGTDTIAVRIVAVSAGSVEREYDLAPDATPEDRLRQWQLPARLMAGADGKQRILNWADLQARLADWLKRGNMTPEACGKWIFTWNAFKIECDAESVVSLIDGFSFGPSVLSDKMSYSDPIALTSGKLVADPTGKHRYRVHFNVDPEAVRRQEAKSAEVVAQIMGKIVEPENRRGLQSVSGTVDVLFVADELNRPVKRERTIALDLVRVDGVKERRESVETLERISIAAQSAQ